MGSTIRHASLFGLDRARPGPETLRGNVTYFERGKGALRGYVDILDLAVLCREGGGKAVQGRRPGAPTRARHGILDLLANK